MPVLAGESYLGLLGPEGAVPGIATRWRQATPGPVVQGRELGVVPGVFGPPLHPHRAGEPGSPFLRYQRVFPPVRGSQAQPWWGPSV